MLWSRCIRKQLPYSRIRMVWQHFIKGLWLQKGIWENAIIFGRAIWKLICQMWYIFKGLSLKTSLYQLWHFNIFGMLEVKINELFYPNYALLFFRMSLLPLNSVLFFILCPLNPYSPMVSNNYQGCVTLGLALPRPPEVTRNLVLCECTTLNIASLEVARPQWPSHDTSVWDFTDLGRWRGSLRSHNTNIASPWVTRPWQCNVGGLCKMLNSGPNLARWDRGGSAWNLHNISV